MRILYICRLFSGFEDSLKCGSWDPKGAPTIAKMIEHLDEDKTYTLTLAMTCKDFNSDWPETTDKILTSQPLQTPIHVLAGQRCFPSWFWKFRDKCRDLRQVFVLTRLYHKIKPDLIYCDRVNISAASFFAHFTKTPVVWRPMGVLSEMHKHLEQNSMRARFQRFLYKSPFAHVICSLDGSGGDQWMDKALHPNTPRTLLVNGYDPETQVEPVILPKLEGLRVLFAGRIEHLKGLDVLLNAAEKLDKNIQIIVAGYGGSEDWLKQEVSSRNLQHKFHFTGALNAAQMKSVRIQCDLALSCGTHGNMTNTVIEALSDGLCTVIPLPRAHVDHDTNAFIPENAAVRYGAQDDSGALASTINALYKDPSRKEQIAQAGQAFAKVEIKTWDERITQELEILKTSI